MKSRTLLTTAALIAAALFILDVPTAYGQDAGDYKTDTAGAWGVAGNWQRHNGTSWVDPAPDYPGQSSPLGLVTVDHAMTVAVANAAGGTLDANASVTINANGTLTAHGAIDADANITINANGTLVIDGAGTSDVASPYSMTIAATDASNYGTLQISWTHTIGGTGVIDGTHDAALITIDSTKELILEASITGNLSIEGAGNFTNQGTVQADNSGTLLVDISGTLDDDSTADWNATTTSGALLQFGNSLDDNNTSISLDGDFTISQAGAEIQIDEMTGLTSAFTTTGKLTLSAGTLDVDEDVTMGSVGYTLNMTGGTIDVATGMTFTHY